MNQGTDRRITRTREALLAALVLMMQEKPLHSITVAELARQANINRATFYLHYQDIYDMVETIQIEVCEEIAGLIQVDENAQIIGINDALVMVFETINRRRLFFAAMFGVNGDHNFTDSVIMSLWDSLSKLKDSPIPNTRGEKSLAALYDNPATRKTFYFYLFYVYGFIGLIKTWIIDGGQETSADMAVMAAKLLSEIEEIGW